MAKNNPNQMKKLSDYTTEELKIELKTAADSSDFGRVQELSKELLGRDKKENVKVELTEELKKIRNKIMKKTATPEEVKKFVKNDLAKWESKTDQAISNIEQFKDSKIAELQKQLEDKDTEMDKYKEAMTTLPGALDLISPKTRKVVRVSRKIQEMNKAKAPVKDILVYCMTVAQGSFLSRTRGRLKRGRVKAMVKRKDASIIQSEELKNIKTMLAPDSKGKSSDYRELLKDLLLKTINEQQQKYAKEVGKQITG